MESPPQRRKPRRPKRRSLSDSISVIGSYTIGWAAPNEQVKFLVDHEDANLWVGFRDGFMSKWTNLNIVCGLIMGAISTVMFAGMELDSVTFGFGIVSLLSSLISIGFGTGLMYVLGDVAGETLNAGIIGSSVLTAIHLVFFARLFHKQHAIETLIDDEPEGAIRENIHLVHLRHGSSDTQTSAALSQTSPGRPERPYVTQYGGSGVGHYRTSPPDTRIQSRPLVESPDPASQVFNISGHKSGGSSGTGKGRTRARSQEEAISEEPVDLFAASERLAHMK
ncbi:hypothetical protein FRC07_006092 [Ceratobasidium sp. 392]|nr:hypothetical protein FRC07_006092 [Ceratobasidium sp. 392]